MKYQAIQKGERLDFTIKKTKKEIERDAQMVPLKYETYVPAKHNPDSSRYVASGITFKSLGRLK